MKVYKMKADGIDGYVKSLDGRLIKIAVAAYIGTLILMSTYLAKVITRPDIIFTLVASQILTIGILFLIFQTNRKLNRLAAENLEIILDDNVITRRMDLSKEPRMNFFHKYLYQRGKNFIGNQYYVQIAYDRMKSVERKDEKLMVKADNHSYFSPHILIVPLEMEGYDEIESLLQFKLSSKKASSIPA
jgi:hypothetical protein